MKPKLTYHAGYAARTEEARAAGMAVENPRRHSLGMEVDLMICPHAACPSGLAPRRPRGQITVLVGLQVITLAAVFIEACEVEFDLCGSAYPLHELPWESSQTQISDQFEAKIPACRSIEHIS